MYASASELLQAASPTRALWRAVSVSLVSTWCAALCAVGCTAVTGSGDYRVHDCGACLAERCGLLSCRQDPSCQPFADCLMACGGADSACHATCFADHWTGSEPQRAIYRCQRDPCRERCPMQGGYFLPVGLACEACMQSRCGQELQACGGETGCDIGMACAGACTEPNCQMGCIDRGYLGELSICHGTPALVSTIGRCRSGCRAECSIGRDFACTGAYSWKAASENVERAYHLVNLLDTAADYPGVEVAVCTEPACQTPVDMAVSDNQGKVCLTFPSQTLGFGGYLRTRDADYEQLYYLRHPVAHVFNADEMIVPDAASAQTALAFVLQLAGEAEDPARAHLAAIAYDCRDAPAEQVRFSVHNPAGDDIGQGDGVVPFFINDDRFPDLEMTATNASGIGGFANLPTADPTVTLRAHDIDSGELLAERQVLVRAGTLTVVNLLPDTQ